MNRTGSRYSRVPPAETTTRRPARSWVRRAAVLAAAGEEVGGQREDLGRVGQPALAGVGAGQAALGGLDHDGTARAQRGHVGLGGGVLPHLGVHRRARTRPGSER